MEALKIIPIALSILTYNCSVDYFNKIKFGSDYEPFNSTVDVCEIIKNIDGLDEDVKNSVNFYIENCTEIVTIQDCEEIISKLRENFNDFVIETIGDLPIEQFEEFKRNEDCINEKIDEYQLFNSFLKSFTNNEEGLKEKSLHSKEIMHPLTIVNTLCDGDRIYGSRFDANEEHMIKLSEIDLCHIQYLIDKEFMNETLSEFPQNCDDAYLEFADRLHPKHYVEQYDFSDFFALKKSDLKKCFSDKIDEEKLIYKLYAINFAYALGGLNIEETKNQTINVLKLIDEVAFGCHGEISNF